MDLEITSPPTLQDVIDDAKEKLIDLKLNLIEVKRLVKGLDAVTKPVVDIVTSPTTDIQLDEEPAAPVDIIMANSLVGSQHLPTPSIDIDISHQVDSISKRRNKWWCFGRKNPRVISAESKSGKCGLQVRKKDTEKKRKSKLCAIGNSDVSAEKEISSEHERLEFLIHLSAECTSERNHHQLIGVIDDSL